MRIISLITFFFLVNNLNLFSQDVKAIEINFIPTFLSKQVQLGQYVRMNQADSIQISTFKFYISNFELLSDNKMVWRFNPGFYLVDIEDTNSFKIKDVIPNDLNFNQISFDLGIDSITNVSGAIGGALDPTKGMYWTWQSGYINLKLEGNCNLSAQTNGEFIFHLGGFQNPFNTIQKLFFTTSAKEKFEIEVELNNWISMIDFTQAKSIMSPRKEAIEMAVKATKMFVLK